MVRNSNANLHLRKNKRPWLQRHLVPVQKINNKYCSLQDKADSSDTGLKEVMATKKYLVDES